jgi:tetratricopeptide (TPR) repeat protein
MSIVARTTLGLLLLFTFACGPSDPLQEIRESHEAGEFEKTIKPLRNILDRDPLQNEAALLLGTALLKTGNAGLAVWPLRKAAETPEYAVAAGLLLTQAMIESRSASDAIKEVDRVLAIEPNNVRALALRADANRADGNIEESLEDIGRVIDLDPENLPVLVSRVTALIALDRIDEAEAALDTAQASFDAAEEKVAHTMLARLCVARALFAFQKGEHDTAERYFAECAERFPSQPIAVEEIVKFYDRIGRPERATEILERAVEESETGLFRTLLARRLGAFGEENEEERLLREEAETRGSTLAWFVLADYYVERDRFDEAIEAFDRAMSVGPASPRLRFAYADTLVQAERFDEARKVAMGLEQPEFRNLILGRTLLGEGKPRRALAAFESGIKLWPNNEVARFFAGQAAERVGDFQRATSHYRESFRTDPRSTEAGRALAELYASRGLYDDALQIASRYMRGHGADPAAYLMSIRIAHAGDREQVVTQGLLRLGKLPGQAAVAVAEGASLLASGGNSEEAVQAVESAEFDLTDPANAIALRVLIDQLGLLGQHEKAAGLVESALAAHPDRAVFHELQGGAERAAGHADSARAAYERALKLDAEDWRALAGLAALAVESGDPTGALTLYDRAIAADPDGPAPALAAIALVRETDPEKTAQRLAELLEQYPREAAAANELAGILEDRGSLDRAAVYARRAAWFGLPEAEKTVARIEKLRSETSETPSTPETPEASEAPNTPETPKTPEATEVPDLDSEDEPTE